MQKFLVANGGRLPIYETMRSTYTTKIETIYFKMTEGEVITVHRTVAKTIVRLVVLLNRPFDHIKLRQLFNSSKTK